MTTKTELLLKENNLNFIRVKNSIYLYHNSLPQNKVEEIKDHLENFFSHPLAYRVGHYSEAKEFIDSVDLYLISYKLKKAIVNKQRLEQFKEEFTQQIYTLYHSMTDDELKAELKEILNKIPCEI